MPDPDAIITADSAASRTASEMPAVVKFLLAIGETAELLVHEPGTFFRGLAGNTGSVIRLLAAGLLKARLPFIILGAGTLLCLVYIFYVRAERERRRKAALRKRRFLREQIAEAEQELTDTEMSLSYLF